MKGLIVGQLLYWVPILVLLATVADSLSIGAWIGICVGWGLISGLVVGFIATEL